MVLNLSSHLGLAYIGAALANGGAIGINDSAASGWRQCDARSDDITCEVLIPSPHDIQQET